MKKLLKLVGIILGALLLLAAVFIGYLTVTEYRPAPIETVVIAGEEELPVFSDNSLTVLSMNIGYAALGKDSDFFMDGGKSVRPDSIDTISKNLAGISAILQDNPADVYFLQEVDQDSKRSFFTDEQAALIQAIGGSAAYALNYRCNYVPFPLPTIGKVTSGLLTLSQYRIGTAQRHALPVPFSWPVSTANLKRCLLVSYLPIDGTEKQLVLINFHLEAYDDGEGKKAQTEQLLALLQDEYAKGNYVIAGGDFNQLFPGTEITYPNTHQELWTPGILMQDVLPEGWQYAYDDSVPSCRLLNQPYQPSDTVNTQHYVIDGFILSPNVHLQAVQTLDVGFIYSDHNPVLLNVGLAD